MVDVAAVLDPPLCMLYVVFCILYRMYVCATNAQWIYEKVMELQEDSKRKRRSFSKEFKLNVIKYYGNLKNDNKTATHFHVDRKQ